MKQGVEKIVILRKQLCNIQDAAFSQFEQNVFVMLRNCNVHSNRIRFYNTSSCPLNVNDGNLFASKNEASVKFLLSSTSRNREIILWTTSKII